MPACLASLRLVEVPLLLYCQAIQCLEAFTNNALQQQGRGCSGKLASRGEVDADVPVLLEHSTVVLHAASSASHTCNRTGTRAL